MQQTTPNIKQTPRQAPQFTPNRLQVLAIHGSASSGRQWLPFSTQIGDAAQVHAPDLLGYGKATAETGNRLTALVKHIRQGSGRFHLVAHSFGGAVALRLAHTCPDRVASVTLYDPIAADPDATGCHRLPGALDRVWRCHGKGPASELMSRFYNFWSTDSTWADLLPHQQDRLLRDHAGLCRDMMEVTRGDWAIPKHTYQGQLTIFRGQHSPDVTGDMAQSIARTHPQTSIIPLAGMGHFAPLTHAETLNTHLIAALLHHAADATQHAA